jgi:hypothetical protein
LRRTISSAARQPFTDRSIFSLTRGGMHLAEWLLQAADVLHPLDQVQSTVLNAAPRGSVPLPLWNPGRRELSVGRVLIKRFNVPAENQEIILSSFQEESWPEHIDDPLPPAAGLDPKRRLHSAIQCLNRNQKAPLLRFRGDGYGSGIRWERLTA